MNNKEFIAELAARAGYSSQEAQRIMNTLTVLMGEHLIEGDSIMVTNFGLFEVKKRNERIIINPSTGKRMLVPPKLTLNFRPHVAWREPIKNGV